MNDAQLLRYSRHILLNELGDEGQEQLLKSHVLIVGAGGLGSPVAMYLTASGVGHITLIDNDRVDLTNLQRQIVHTTSRIGVLKTESARRAMLALNPDIQITCIDQRADRTLLEKIISGVDVVVDCCDNFATRHDINWACVKNRKPLVSGAVIRLDGQLTSFDTRIADSPCYACLFPPDRAPEEVSCATMGVLAPLVGVIGSLQAAQAIQLLTNLGTSLVGRLQLFDGRSLSWTELQIKKDPQCTVCSNSHLMP